MNDEKSLKKPGRCVAVVDVPINEVLTQRTCALIVIEIIKFLCHQKLQTPFGYDQLKFLVERKRRQSADVSRESWSSRNYFRVASSAVDNFESLFENILCEVESGEVMSACVMLGATSGTAREVYRIVLPHPLSQHYHRNHSPQAHKLLLKTMRSLMFSHDLQKLVYQPLPPTNMFIFLQKHSTTDTTPQTSKQEFSKFFLPVNSLRISPKVPQAIINLDYTPPPANCCTELKIYCDLFSPKTQKSDHTCSKSSLDSSQSSKDASLEHSIESLGQKYESLGLGECIVNNKGCQEDGNIDDMCWFQAKVSLKGFKDSVVNGQSVTDLWLKP